MTRVSTATTAAVTTSGHVISVLMVGFINIVS